MTQEQFEMLMQLLGQVGGEAYRAAMAHVVADAVAGLLFGSLWLILVWVAERYIHKQIRTKYASLEEHEMGDYIPEWVCRLFPSAVRWVFTFVNATMMFSNIVNLIAPHYAALKALAELVTRTAAQ